MTVLDTSIESSSHINVSQTGVVLFFSVLKGMLIFVEHTDFLYLMFILIICGK